MLLFSPFDRRNSMKTPSLLIFLHALLLLAQPGHAGMVNRWTFNRAAGTAPTGTEITDCISGAVAVVRSGTAAANQAVLTGTSLTLPGTTTGNQTPATISAYLDLPNGLISSKTNLTVEIWATPLSVKNFQRLFDFGRTDLSGNRNAQGNGAAAGEILSTATAAPGATNSSDDLTFMVNRGTTANTQRLAARLNGATELDLDTAQTLTSGTEYQFVVTFADGIGASGTNGGQLAWYLNGNLVSTLDVNFHLSSIEDVNNWLGRSQYSTDSSANISYDEVRIYDNALTAADIATSFSAGPDLDTGMVNRWSFNTTSSGSAATGTSMVDSISGAIMTLYGNGATLSGTSITLPGTTTGNQTAAAISAYLDLPNGIVSSKKNLTLELWATPLSAKNWMRVFDFGRVNTAGVGGGATGEVTGTTTTAPGTTSASDDLMLSFVINGDINQQRMESVFNGTTYGTVNTAIPTSLNTQYHYVFTFEDGVGVYGSSGGQMTWYRDGIVIGTSPAPFHLSDMQDVNNWLGRSQWSADTMTNASYNDVRIYNYAMTPAQVAASKAAGPNSVAALVTATSSVLVPAQPTNRWSFNNTAGTVTSGTTFTDSIGGAIAVVRGTGATLTGTAITLPGITDGNQTAANISAYIDLPNGIVSSKPNFTAEFWVTPLSTQNYQRLFDVGRSTLTVGTGAATGEIIEGNTAPGSSNGYDNLCLSLNIGTTLGLSELEGQIGGNTPLISYTDLSSVTSIGTEYHYTLTVEDNAGYYGTAGSLAKWYRDGALQGVLHLNYHLSQMSDVNNWIGRSQYTADSNSHIAVSEVRLYNRVLSPEEVKLSDTLGSSASFGAVVTHPDSVTINPGQKVLIPVLANDTGSITPSTVQIVSAPTVGTATVDSSGSKILYVHAGISYLPVTFTYRVYGYGGYSAPETVTVNISNDLRVSNTVGTTGTAGTISTINVPSTPPSSSYQLVNAFSGLTFSRPVCFTSPPSDTKRLFVGEISGTLNVIADVTATSPTKSVVLDLPSILATRSNPGESIVAGNDGECGLLGVAFHPNYATNGYFYVAYSVRKSTDSSVWYQRLSRFTVPQAQISAAAPVADPTSEVILIEQRDREDNHNGGGLHFGSDGYLYWCVGDEGNGYDHFGNSQNIQRNFFSALLRIDVDKKLGNLEPHAHPNPNETELNPSGYPVYVSTNAIPRDSNGKAYYSIPVDNPFVSTSEGGKWDGTFNGVAISATNLPYVRSEFYAVGLRSPWGFSFDSATGDLWMGDVGQDAYEEVDIITKGGNYGWVYREGKHDTNFTTPVPPTKPAGLTSTDPVWDYAHTGVTATGYTDANFKGNCVIGGVVYRGTRLSSLTGSYIFSDFNYNQPTNVWSLVRSGTNVTVKRLTGVAGVVYIGTDPSNGDVLLANINTGTIQRLTTGGTSDYPNTLSATGLFADLTDLSPSPGVLSYAPNVAFWSDFAKKSRWFMMPDATSTMTWSADDPWTFPAGMVWVKHFDMPLVRSNPPLSTDPTTPSKRIETRLLVRNASGVYGVSYRWNDAQTDATLVPEEGVDIPLTVTENGVSRTQTYHIPSRSECLACHTQAAGMALSFNTRQLNCSGTMSGVVGNQITLLHNSSFFSNAPSSVNLLPRYVRSDETSYPVETRVRSYLAVNCSQCHRGAGSPGAPAVWNALPQLKLSQMGLVNTYGINYPDVKLINPGDKNTSLVYNRVAKANGYSRMPPIGSNELDQKDIALLADWITNSVSAHQTYDQWRLATFGSSTSAAGDPNADPDGDGRTNMEEFLALTNPLDAQSYLAPVFNVGTNTVTVSFIVPTNRLVYVETSTDLKTWFRWDVPGNGGSPMPVGTTTLIGPILGPKQFFRLQVQEN